MQNNLNLKDSKLEEIWDKSVIKNQNKFYEKVMIVDDDESQLFSIKKILDKEYDLILCDRGQKAIDYYKEYQDVIKAILLDIRLPDIDGFEVFKAIKEINENIPIIFITGYQSTYGDGYEIYKQYRPHGYIVKNHENEVQMIRDTLENAVKYYNRILENQRSISMVIRNQFMAGLMHDLTNLFAPILMITPIAQLFLNRGDYEKTSELLAKLKRSSEFYAANQRVLFNYAKGENIHIQWETYSIRKLLEDLIVFIQPSYEGKVNVNLHLYCDQDFVTDRNVLLCQILLNIIKNANEACHGRIVDINISSYSPQLYNNMLGEEAVLGKQSDGTIILIVSDNAGGMTQEVERRLFTPYFSVGKKEGTGLGTWMIRNGVEDLLKGQLKLVNKKGVGVAYHLAFPQAIGFQSTEGK